MSGIWFDSEYSILKYWIYPSVVFFFQISCFFIGGPSPFLFFSTKSASKFWRLKSSSTHPRAPRKDIGFLTVNLAAYSPRPNTPAAELQDQVPEVPVAGGGCDGGRWTWGAPIPLKPTRRGPTSDEVVITPSKPYLTMVVNGYNRR